MFDKLMIHLYTIVSVKGVTVFGNAEAHNTTNQPKKTPFPILPLLSENNLNNVFNIWITLN